MPPAENTPEPENTPDMKQNSVIPGRISTLDERLRYMLQAENKTASTLHKELSEEYGIKRAYETVLGWLKKRDDNTEPLIYLGDLKAIANILRVNTLWLATGEGPCRELFDFMKHSGHEQSIWSKKELEQHLLSIHHCNIPLYISDFDPFVHSGSVFLSPDTELTDFILARYAKNLANNSGYHILLRNILNTCNNGLFPDWMITQITGMGNKFLRMYYVRDNSMSPLLNESDLAVVDTCFDPGSIRKFLKTNHVYAFVSVYGYVYFRRVQINYNGSSVTLTGENCEPETVPLSEISTLPNTKKLLDDEMFFSYLELPPVTQEELSQKNTANLSLPKQETRSPGIGGTIIISDDTAKELFQKHEELLKYPEYQDYDNQKKEKGHLKLQDIPRYQKLFLIGKLVYRRESLKPSDMAYSAFCSLFDNFGTIDYGCSSARPDITNRPSVSVHPQTKEPAK